MGTQKSLLAAIAILLALTTGVSADVIARRLNLRAGPGPAFPIVAVIPAGAQVAIQKCNDDWCRLKFGRRIGYASRLYLGVGTDTYASAEPPPAAETNSKPTLTGPRIWRWQDREARDRNWRSLGWHNRLHRH